MAEVRRRLQRLNKASRTGPWTEKVFNVLGRNEGVRASDLAPLLNLEKAAFKLNVPKLKNLGLTESLGTGYRLSPWGIVVLKKLGASEEP